MRVLKASPKAVDGSAAPLPAITARYSFGLERRSILDALVATLPTPPRHSYTQAQLNNLADSTFPRHSSTPQFPSLPTYYSSPVSPHTTQILPPPVVHLQTVYTYYYHLPLLLHPPTLLPYYFACSESTCKPNLNHSPLDPQPDTVWNTTLLPYYFVEHYPTSLLLCRTIPCSLLLCLAA